MNSEARWLTTAEEEMLTHTVLHRERLEEQYENLEHQHHAAANGMWVFLATEVMFFGGIFLSMGVYRFLYGDAFEKASAKLNWIVGGINTIVLLTSSLSIVLAVYYAQRGNNRRIAVCMAATVLLGFLFLGLKGYEYYHDYRENLIPGWKFSDSEWVDHEGLSP